MPLPSTHQWLPIILCAISKMLACPTSLLTSGYLSEDMTIPFLPTPLPPSSLLLIPVTLTLPSKFLLHSSFCSLWLFPSLHSDLCSEAPHQKDLPIRNRILHLYFNSNPILVLFFFTSLLNIICRNILFYCTSLCLTDAVFFLQLEGLWQLCIDQVCQPHFRISISICVSYCGNSHNILNFLKSLLYLLQWRVIAIHWKLRGRLPFLSNRVFLSKACTFYFRDHAIARLIDYGVMWT